MGGGRLAFRYIDDGLAEDVRAYYCVSYEEQKLYHEKMLLSIMRDAGGSQAYAGRLPAIDTIDRLDDVPMTCWEDIHTSMERHGLDGTLLSKPARYWQTSGYTGVPKRFYFDGADVERMHRYILEMLFLTGVFESDAYIVNLGEKDPYLPGTLFDDCFARFGRMAGVKANYGSCVVTDEKGFVRALRMLSKIEGANVMLSFPIVYYLVGTFAESPGRLEDKVAGVISRLSFLPFKVLPDVVSKALARAYLHDVDTGHIRGVLNGIKIGFCYGEHIGPYKKFIDMQYPSIRMHSVLGSTEMIMQAFHVSGDEECMMVPLKHYIPEIARPEDVEAAKSDPARALKATPWYRWEKGLIGELVITRPGGCLPLIRYPTGDLVEVISPEMTEKVSVREWEFTVRMPAIRLLGRSVDAVDFDAPEQGSAFFGYKFYAKNVDDALSRAGNVRWWELYRLHGSPGRMLLWIVPETPVNDIGRYRKAIISSLLSPRESQSVSFSLAMDLDALDVIVSTPEAYDEIEKGIVRRVREGRPLGRIKPRHVYKLDDEAEYAHILNEKKKRAA